MQYLEGDPRCAFEIALRLNRPIVASVAGQRLRLCPSWERMYWRQLLHCYQGGLDNKLASTLLKGLASEVAIRLEPVSGHAWNFSPRMQGVSAQTEPKPCPEVF